MDPAEREWAERARMAKEDEEGNEINRLREIVVGLQIQVADLKLKLDKIQQILTGNFLS